jgi:type VI secretion system protein ImpA
MGSPDTIDFDRLLAPVSETSPVGEDLRQDASPSSPYYLLKDARKVARAKERNAGIDDAEVPDTRAEWRPVMEQAQTLLAERSKDLEVAAWLIEALVRLQGFAGLRDGFRLARELITRFWDSCYPTQEEADIEERVAPLAGLNGQDAEGTLIVPIRNVEITEGKSVGPFASWHFQQAVALQQIADPAVREKRIEAGAVSFERIDKAVVETDPSFFRTRLEDLDQCGEEFSALSQLLDERCGAEFAPPSSNIRNELKACQEALRYVAKSVLEEAQLAAEGEAGSEQGANGEDAGPSSNLPTSAPRDREQAFKTLLLVADFFRRTEPHSPLSYSIEQVVRWGRMPLPELLEEIIAEDAARQNLFRLAGIRKPDQEG